MDAEPKEGIPAWGDGIGWALGKNKFAFLLIKPIYLAALAIFQIPLWIFITVYRQPGSIKQVSKMFN